MGCNQSTESGKNQVAPGDQKNQNSNATTQNSKGHVKNNSHNVKSHDSTNNNQPKGKSVAFEVEIENTRTYDSLVKHPPQKFKRLEPLSDAPKFSAEQLEEKIRLAEENRQKELEKKKEVGRRSQRLRAEIQKSREVERASEQQRELDSKLQAAEEARRQKAREQEEKKRIREERAQRAREKAKREKAKQDGGEDLDYEIEKDDAFNAGDDESWLEGENNKTSDYHTDNDRYNSGVGDRVYSGGRESPAKGTRPAKQDRIFSSSTTDSYDNAFQRNKPSYNQEDDDFFDT